jgi:hypothetical protein
MVSRGAFHVDAATVQICVGDHGAVVLDAGEGGLRLWQNETGLYFEAALPPQPARAALSLGCCSVQFDANTWELVEWVSSNGQAHRVIAWADIDHIAIVSRPAYPTAVWAVSDEVKAGLLRPAVARIAAASAVGRPELDGQLPAIPDFAAKLHWVCSFEALALRKGFAEDFYRDDPVAAVAFMDGQLEPPAGAAQAWFTQWDWLGRLGGLGADVDAAFGFRTPLRSLD